MTDKSIPSRTTSDGVFQTFDRGVWTSHDAPGSYREQVEERAMALLAAAIRQAENPSAARRDASESLRAARVLRREAEVVQLALAMTDRHEANGSPFDANLVRSFIREHAATKTTGPR